MVLPVAPSSGSVRAIPIANARENEAETLSESRFDGRSMGSPLRLTLTNVPLGEAEDGWRAVLDEFDAVDRAMSAYRADSAISELNEHAGHDEAVGVDPRLYEAIRLGDRAWRLTDGRFDILVLDALQDLGRPGLHRLTAAKRVTAPTTGSGIRRDPRRRRVALSAPADLGGIGKGLALRWAWRLLASTVDLRGRGALLEAGGDLVLGGHAPDGGEWSIGIEAPDGGSEPIAVVGLDSGSLCTSSTRLATWVDGSGEMVHRPCRPSHGAAGRRGPDGRHGRRCGPGLGRDLEQGIVPGWSGGDRRSGAKSRVGSLVDQRGRWITDDAGSEADHALAMIRWS